MTGTRIRQLRLAAGLTLDELVDKLTETGVLITKQALSNYEKDRRIPKPTILMALGKVFNVKTAHLLSEPSVKIEWLSYRCQTALRVRDKNKIQAQAESQAEQYMHLQNLLLPGMKSNLPSKKVSSFEDAEKAAEALRRSWKLGFAPIDSLTQTIESNGGIVVEIPRDSIKFDGLSGQVNGRFPLIAVNTAVPHDRIRFNLAHELGHLVMNCDDVEPEDEEKLANRFAASFLAPADVVYLEMGKMRRSFGFREIGLLKQKYGLSMAAWLFRMFDLEIISKNAFISAFTEFSKRGWRKEEPVQFVGSESPMRFKQMVLWALSEGVITAIKAEEFFPGIIKELQNDESIEKSSSMKPSELMKLSKSERLKIIATSAKAAKKMYAKDADLKDFDAFGEDDLHE